MKRSQILFIVMLLVLAIQRLLELRVSNRHAATLLRNGGREHAPAQYQVMKLLHSSWFVAMVLEIVGRRRSFRPWLAAPAGLLFLTGQALRYAAIRTLGERWTARVVTLPGAPPVTNGIYRYLRHPNYLGVVLEIAAVPVIHSAYWTALLFSLANLLLLRDRVHVEERALAVDNGYARYITGSSGSWLSGLRISDRTPALHDAHG